MNNNNYNRKNSNNLSTDSNNNLNDGDEMIPNFFPGNDLNKKDINENERTPC